MKSHHTMGMVQERATPFVPIADRRYRLVDCVGDYVQKVETTGWETVKLRFIFTKDKTKAKIFSYDDLFSPLATTSVG